MAITATGYQSSQPYNMLTKIQGVFVGAFGSNFNLTPSGSNGIITALLTTAAISVEATKLLLYSGVYDPDKANDIWLDSIANLSDIKRKPATQSVVTCQVSGMVGLVIPAGSNVINTNGDLFYNPSAITIGSNGQGVGTFLSYETGAILCGIGTVTGIVQTLSGWDSVTNAADGVQGVNIQSNTNFRVMRKGALAKMSAGGYLSIRAACEENVNILAYDLINNNTANPIKDASGTITIPAHSIYLSVYFGNILPTPQQYINEVAQLLAVKLSGGCGMAGNTNAIYVDPLDGSEFAVTFNIAIATPIYVVVNMDKSSTIYPADAITQIQNALISNMAGNDDIQPVEMGGTIKAGRFYQSISLLGFYQIDSIFVGLTANPTTTAVTLPISQMPYLTAANIIVNFIDGEENKD